MNTWYQINGKNLSFSSKPLSFYMETHNGLPYTITFDDGGSQTYNSGENAVYIYSGQSNYPSFQISNPLNIKRIKISETLLVNLDMLGVDNIENFDLNNPTAVIGSLNNFANATGLTFFKLYNLPNSNIDGSINSFTNATGLTTFWIQFLSNANVTGSINSFSSATGLKTFYLHSIPNANITGSLNSFSGATGLTTFYLYNLLNATITGSFSDFSNAPTLETLYIYNMPNSTFSGSPADLHPSTSLFQLYINTFEYTSKNIDLDSIVNIFQNSAVLVLLNSGISASKTTTNAFSLQNIVGSSSQFRGIGLSTQSMDNMIISLDNSLISQSSPKTIYLNGNAPHSGSPAVMSALSNLANKNLTVVL